jgi:mannose-6-phosphate isomerase-like protein (cupin superfamily)
VDIATERTRPIVEWRPGVGTRLHAAASTGADRLCLIEQLCDPGAGAPPHRHEDVEEVLAVLEGRARVRVEDEAAELRAGESVVIPPGAWHGFTNVGDGVLRTFAAFSSATPPVEYEGEPDVLEIGGGGSRRRDPHRTYADRDA